MEKRLLLPLFCCFGISLALKSWELPVLGLSSLITKDLDQEWIVFKKIYNKTYVGDNEELRRRLYWEDTVHFILEHNLKYDRGESTYSLGENEFSDMAEDEFEKLYMKGKTVSESSDDESHVSSCNCTPSEIDWRKKGFVSPVKNQGHCGASHIFAPVESLEGVYAIAKRVPFQQLSVQNVIDCIQSRGGCRGGYVTDVYKYIIKNGGIDSAACYPSTSRKGRCRYTKSCKAASCSGYKNVMKNEDSLKFSVAHAGPVVVAIDVNHRSFFHYKQGIWYEPRCSKTRPNHAMLAVGYGTAGTGKDYWIIKNSWGTSWGNKGYVYTARNKNNMCGVASFATYPIV